MTIGGIQAFVSYVTFMMWPIQDLARVYAEMQHAIASAERIFSLIDAVPEVVDRPGAIDPGTCAATSSSTTSSFYYEQGKPVLTTSPARQASGETIALVGPTGGGKSTIVNLLCRFYEPKRAHAHRRARLHASCRCTPSSRAWASCCRPRTCSRHHPREHPLRPAGRQRRRGRGRRRAWPARTTSSPPCPRATREVGEGGNLLSVGQKQLISLARACWPSPEIFIMDEATSSVDTLTEALIQQGMETLMEGPHQLSSSPTGCRPSARRPHPGDRGRPHRRDGQPRRAAAPVRGHYYNLYTQQFRDQSALHLVPVTGQSCEIMASSPFAPSMR
jgi:ATP-binding cassette, subfamily B, bacterial